MEKKRKKHTLLRMMEQQEIQELLGRTQILLRSMRENLNKYRIIPLENLAVVKV